MSIQKIERTGNKVRLVLEIVLDSESMLSSEENIEQALNEAGVGSSKLALELFDTTGEPIEVAGKRMTSKGQQKKISVPMGGGRAKSARLSK